MSPIALKVGELYALMRLDDTQFNRGLDQSRGRFEGLKSAIGSGVKVMATAFAATTTAVAGLGVAAFKVGLDYNRMQQSSRAALTTLLGSAEAANAQMDKLDEFARTSPFSKDVFIRAQQQLIGFGREAEQVVPILDAVQNAVAAAGGSNQDISELVTIIAQIGATGKITAEHLNQFGYRGVDAATIIGEAMGKTGAQIREDITSGALDAEDAIVALTDGMMARFGGATALIKEQMDGAADRVKAAFRDIGSVLAAPFVDPKGGGMLVVWTNEVADAMRAFETKLKPLVALLVDRFGPGLAQVSPLLQSVTGLINSWDISQVNRQIDTLSGYTPLIAGLSAAMLALGGNSLGLSRLGLALNPVVAGLAALAATSPEVRTMLAEFARSLSPLLPVLGAFGVLLADTAMLVLRELAPALTELLVAGGDVAVALGSALVPALGDLLVAGAPLVGMLADLVGWVAGLPTPLLAAVVAFVALRGPINDVVSSVSGPLRLAFSNMSEYMAASRAVMEATGGQVSGLRASFEAARTGAVNLGAALRGAFLASGIGLAISGVVAALSMFVASQAEAKREAEELRHTLDEQTGALTTNSEAWAAKKAQDEGWLDIAEQIGVSTQDITAAMLGNEDAAARVQAAIDGVTKSTDEFGIATYTAADGTRVYQTDLLKLQEGLASTAETTRQQQEEQRQLAGAQRDAGAAADEHRQAQEDLRAEMEESIDATLSAAEAALRVEDAQARATEAIERKREADARLAEVMASGTATEEERTEATRAAEQATRDADGAILNYTRQVDNHIGALGRNNASYGELRAEMARARESFIVQREQMGMTRREAEALADQYGLVPSRIDTMVHLGGVQAALNAIGSLDRTLNSINGKTVTANVAIRQYGQAAIASGGYLGDFAAALGYAGGGAPKRFPGGGLVLGPGTPTSDEIPAWLSPTEFVQRAAAVQKYGLDFMHSVNSLRFPVELARPFKVGGYAGATAPPPPHQGNVHVNPYTGPRVSIGQINTGANPREIVDELEWAERTASLS